MAIKLYPPQIEGILPAFYKNYEKETGELKNAAIAIPFGMNRAVTIEDVYSLSLRIKTVSTNTIIDVRQCDSFDKTELIAYFTIPQDIAEKFNEGQFYKAQLAFVNRNEIDGTEVTGYYSTVGTLKCVAKPTVTIAGYDSMKINTFIQEFIGEYQQNTNFGDSTEKVETYEFNLWDNTNQLILSSGTLLHNSADDVSSSSSTDVFKIHNEIDQNQLYYIQYTVTTLNNLTISSPLYKVMQGHSVDIQHPLKLRGKNNYENGYIELSLEGGLNDNGTEKLCTGTFLITRGSEIDNYFEWNEIIKFNMEGKPPSSYVFRDFTVEQGIRYKYRIQQYNQYELYSNPVYLTYPEIITVENAETGTFENKTVETEYSILADFEDMFIYDGKRQLKVKFNPKVSSFKNTIPEQKIETIGSKYPFIFRSGHVNYKEFPVSGLISFNMDEAMLFLTQTELLEAKLLEPTYVRTQSGKEILQSTNSNIYSVGHEIQNIISTKQDEEIVTYPAGTVILNKEKKIWDNGIETEYSSNFSDLIMRSNKDLTTENLMSERYFKLKVLDWLTDGQVKLFRSPGEGNYLVRILNVSMTPTDSLGRMLHTFQGTCYEIDDLTYNNLIHYGIVTENIFALTETHWGSISINEFINNNDYPWNDFIIDPTANPPKRLLEQDWHGYYLLPLQSNSVLGFECFDCAPGDILWITYAGADDDVYIKIGDTGSYSYLYDDRIIEKIAFLPDPNFADFHEFTRIINYYYEGIQNRKFDTIKDIFSTTEVSKQYIGPYDNLFENYLLYTYSEDDNGQHDLLNKIPLIDIQEDNTYYMETEQFTNIVNDIKRHPNIILAENAGGNTVKFDTVQVEILHAMRRPLIPIYVTQGFDPVAPMNNLKFTLTPFGSGYVNYRTIYDATQPDKLIKTVPDNVLQHIIETNELCINEYDIENIDFELANTELDSPLGEFDIYQVFIPIASENSNNLDSWQATNCYFDTYYQSWSNTYDPSFSINNINNELYLLTPRFKDIGTGNIVTMDYPYPTILINNFSKENIADADDYVTTYLNTYNTKYRKSGTPVLAFYPTQELEEKYTIKSSNDFNNVNNIDLSDIEEVKFTHLGKIDNLRIGNGVVINLTFQLQIVDYAIEDDNNIVKGNKSDYLNKKNQYNQKLSDYFSIQTNTSQQELSNEIEELENEILELAKNIDTHFIDEETGELVIQSDDNGTPIITGSDDSSYQKIIDSATAAKTEAIEAKPLKQQLILIANKCFNDMLKGWTDDLNKQHYGLLYLHPFKFGELPDMNYNNKTINTNQSPGVFDYPVFGSNYIEPILGESMVDRIYNENNYWPNRRVPIDYTSRTNPPFKNALLYNGVEVTNSVTKEKEIVDNSYSIFTPIYLPNNNLIIDVKMQNIFYSLLLRIDKKDFKNKLKNFYFYNKVNGGTYDYEINSDTYTYSNGTAIDSTGRINQVIENTYTLMDFITEHEFNINVFENFFNLNNEDLTLPYINELLINIKNNYIDLLYLLAHSPFKNENNTILNPFLYSQNIELLQNKVEEDWASTKDEAINLINSFQIPEILKGDNLNDLFKTHISESDPHGLLEDYLRIDYLKYTESSLELDRVYYINIDGSYKMIYPVDLNKLYYKINGNDDGQSYSYTNGKVSISNTNYDVYRKELIYINSNPTKTITLNKTKNTPVLEIDKTEETAILNSLKDNYLQTTISFFNNKVGRFIEAKDDMDILLTDLLENYVIPYYEAYLFNSLYAEAKNNIPANIENYTVEEYLLYLSNTKKNIQNSIQTWSLVYTETTAILNDETTTLEEDKREELEQLRSTAKYNLQIKELELEDIIQQENNFMDTTKNGPYVRYLRAKDSYAIVQGGILIPVQQKIEAAFTDYKEARNIYLYFISLLKALFTKDLNSNETEDKKDPFFYQNLTNTQLTNYIKEYTNRTEYADNYSNYQVDLLNHKNSTIEIPMGYFELLKMLNTIVEEIQKNPDSQFSLNKYKNIIEQYKAEALALQTRYDDMVKEILEIINIYQGRASFIASLDAIINKYADLIETGKVKLRKLINRLQKLKDNLIKISDENAPTSEEVNAIWEALTKYLLCLEKYYIQEVERRYEV